MRHMLTKLILMLFLILGAAGCSQQNKDSSSINQYIKQLKANNSLAETFSTDMSSGIEYLDISEEEATSNGLTNYSLDGYHPIYKKANAKTSTNDIISWGANDDITFPGSTVFISNPYDTNILSPIIQLKRAPITISMGLEGTGAEDISTVVENVTLSNLRNAISKLNKSFQEQNLSMPARLSYEFCEVKSQNELSVALGASMKLSPQTKIAGNFDFTNKTSLTYAILLIKEIYYTIDVDYDFSKGAFGFFSDDTTLTEIQENIPNDSVPAYVSSVSYGRVAAITIKTNLTMSEIKEKFEINVGSFVDTNNNISIKTDTSEMELNYFVYGGENIGMPLLNPNNISEFVSILNSDYNSQSMIGLPISYRLSHLGDGTLAKIGSVNQYYIKEYISDNIYFEKVIRETNSQTIRVSDSGVKEPISFALNSNDLLDKGYQKYEIVMYFNMKEEEDGYQHISILVDGVEYGKTTYEHGGNGRNTNWASYEFRTSVNINSFQTNELTIFYKPSGLTIWGGMNDFIIGKTTIGIKALY